MSTRRSVQAPQIGTDALWLSIVAQFTIDHQPRGHAGWQQQNIPGD
jgi:hypothetical protein